MLQKYQSVGRGEISHSVICSDKASISVSLGSYDHKVQLLADISNSEQLGGMPIILRGLHAAREQFQQHGRTSVSRILLLVTSGANRFVFQLIEKNLCAIKHHMEIINVYVVASVICIIVTISNKPIINV